MVRMDYGSVIIGLKNRLLDTEQKLNYLIEMFNNRNTANIDYVAMMTDVELPGSEEIKGEEE